MAERRVRERVSLPEARKRLAAYVLERCSTGPFRASELAYVIWPDAEFLNSQGAGAAASRVLKRLGCVWGMNLRSTNWGWFLRFKPVWGRTPGDNKEE